MRVYCMCKLQWCAHVHVLAAGELIMRCVNPCINIWAD